MKALLERLNASRRFARSVYAPHKLALRQHVPSVLQAVGVTEPALRPHKASRSLAARTLTEAAPEAARADAPLSRPVAEKPAAPKPQDAGNLEPQDAGNLGLPLENLVTSEEFAPLRASAPDSPVPSEPWLEAAEVVTQAPLESGVGVLAAQTPLEQPTVDRDPIQAQPSVAALRADQPQMTALDLSAPDLLASDLLAPEARAVVAAPLEPAAQTLGLAQTDALSAWQMPAAPPAQPLEAQSVALQAVSSEPQSADSEIGAISDFLNLNEVAPPQSVALEDLQAPMVAQSDALETVPETTAVEMTAPETTAPEMTAPSASDSVTPETVNSKVSVAEPPAPSADSMQSPAKKRVIEEFQARPPRNMPPRDLQPQAVEPAPEPVSQKPERSAREWARALQQRYPQPGEVLIEDVVEPDAPATNPNAPQSAPSQLQSASLEPSATDATPTLAGLDNVSSAPDSSQDSSPQSVLERTQAAMRAIPEDMSKRTERDWSLALLRRYASADEAAAIGIEAYRDPNDKTPIPAPVPAAPSESVRTIAPRVAPPSPASSSPALNATRSSSPIAPTSLESTPTPARRFVAPRMAVSSTVPSLNAIPPVPGASVRAQPTAAQRNPAPLEPPSRGLEFTSQTLEPNRPVVAAVDPQAESSIPALDALLDPPKLENQDFAEPEPLDGEPRTRAAFPERPIADAVPNSDVPASPDAPAGTPPRDRAQSDESAAAPTLEPVTLSGATRRFLEPLVGFDPSEVGVYTGDAASRVTSDLRADAAAQDGTVLLPDASNLETPAQLGLLAHELIHAAQQQRSADSPRPASLLPDSPPASSLEPVSPQPSLETPRSFESVSRRFVPAVGSSDTRSTALPSSAVEPSNAVQPSNAVRQSRAPLLTGVSSFASEEDRALAAEARVVRIAQTEPLSADPTRPAAAGSWNGLPAPWESLSTHAPVSDDSSSESNVVSLVGASLSPQGWGAKATTTNPSGYGGSVSSSGSSASSASPQAAEVGRELPEAAGAAAGGGPDLEQLAKQVYDVLKRRLQSDRRRGGL